MAENTAQERTEEATPKRLQDVRKKGQVPRSRELSTFVSLMAAGVGLLIFGKYLITGITEHMARGLTLNRSQIFDSTQVMAGLEDGAVFADVG